METEKFKRLKIVLPEREEQVEIVRHLERSVSRLDKLVELTEQAIVFLGEHRTALISTAVTGKIDVRHFKEEAV